MDEITAYDQDPHSDEVPQGNWSIGWQRFAKCMNLMRIQQLANVKIETASSKGLICRFCCVMPLAGALKPFHRKVYVSESMVGQLTNTRPEGQV